jgi:hypothetical protein
MWRNFMNNVIRLSPGDKANLIYNPIDTRIMDVEEWRKHNSMDYIYAIKVMNSFPTEEKAEVFKQIYNITRMYLPEILFKFYSFTYDKSLNLVKLKTLENQKVFLSELSRFNDPYDGRAIFYDTAELKQFDVLKKHKGMLFEDFASYHIGTSLSSSDYMNMPMWAHYSNNHCGYCVSYKTSENDSIKRFAFPMQYLDSRIDITEYIVRFIEYSLREKVKQSALGKKEIILDDLSLIYLIELLDNIKGIDWSYEKEFRLSLPKTHQERYIDLKLRLQGSCHINW